MIRSFFFQNELEQMLIWYQIVTSSYSVVLEDQGFQKVETEITHHQIQSVLATVVALAQA